MPLRSLGRRVAAAAFGGRAALEPAARQGQPRAPWRGVQALPACVLVGALPASRRWVRSQKQRRGFFIGRGAASGSTEKVDPGRAAINWEYLTPGTQLLDLPLENGTAPAKLPVDPGRADVKWEYLVKGRQLLDLPLKNGGSLQVTAHDATENTLPPGVMPGAKQEWRVLRFTPAEGTTNLVQSVTKVSIPAFGPAPQAELQREVLPLGYTKSFATVVLTTLAVLGAPVLPVKAGEDQERLRILCIGLGGGSVPSYFVGGLRHCEVDVVELEPGVVRAATEALGFVKGPRLRATVDDGAAFALRVAEELQRGDSEGGRYHAVLVDAYDAAGNVPSELWAEGSQLAQALRKGLLHEQCGLVATNFLPHVDLREPIAAYKSALASQGAGLGFSVQVNVPDEERTDLLKLLEPTMDTGNRIAVQTCGGPADLTSIEALRERLLSAAVQVEEATGCPFSMRDLAARGLRGWGSA